MPEPQSVRDWYKLALVKEDDGQYAAAVDCLEEALKEHRATRSDDTDMLGRLHDRMINVRTGWADQMALQQPVKLNEQILNREQILHYLRQTHEEDSLEGVNNTYVLAALLHERGLPGSHEEAYKLLRNCLARQERLNKNDTSNVMARHFLSEFLYSYGSLSKAQELCNKNEALCKDRPELQICLTEVLKLASRLRSITPTTTSEIDHTSAASPPTNSSRLNSVPHTRPVAKKPQSIASTSARDASRTTAPSQPRASQVSSSRARESGTQQQGTTETTSETRDRSPDQHQRVLTTADAWLKELEDLFHPLLISETQAEAHSMDRPVKVAIIDTGVDGTHEEIFDYSDRIDGYKSWVDDEYEWTRSGRDTLSRRTLRRFQDLAGHGTYTASVLLKSAPVVRLFIARVDVSSDIPDGTVDQIEQAKRIAEAIKYATTTWAVDIISLSYGYPRYERYMQPIDEAIDASKVIIFASAGNSGAARRIAYPARHDRVIDIHSADGLGAPTTSNPVVVASSFAAVGEEVTGAWPRAIPHPRLNRDNGTAVLSGSSVATPIAAGIASLVIHFVRQEISHPSMVVAEEEMRKVQNMRHVLESISTGTIYPNWKFLHPQLFHKAKEDQPATQSQREALRGRIRNALDDGGVDMP